MQIRPVQSVTCGHAKLLLDIDLRLGVINLVGFGSREKCRRIELHKICAGTFNESWHVNIERKEDYVREQR